ncbi:MAG: iron-containing alcohol dehydrogenase, partial [Myxococcales bacterium]|nr:iron-containing alcohol dehydrogenase [Myxococcales bacterium]
MTTLDRLTAPAALAKTPGRTRHVTLGARAIEELPRWLTRDGLAGDVVLIADEHTIVAAGDRVEAALEASGRNVRRLVLEPRPEDDHLVCEDGVIHALKAILAANRHAIPVAVGAGTVNDIVKMAAHELDRDYVVVPTAASMNGYTSLIA